MGKRAKQCPLGQDVVDQSPVRPRESAPHNRPFDDKGTSSPSVKGGAVLTERKPRSYLLNKYTIRNVCGEGIVQGSLLREFLNALRIVHKANSVLLTQTYSFI